MVKKIRLFLLLFFSLGLIACSSVSEQEQKVFKLISPNDKVNQTWPKANEIAYYVYLGDIYGESNLLKIKNNQESTLIKIWNFITGEITKRNIDLKRPQAMLSDGKGKLYISDVSHQAIFVIDTVLGTQTLWYHSAENKKFISPIGLTFGAENELLVADSELGKVIRLDLSGRPIGVIAHPSLTRPTGIVRIASQQKIYVSDTYNHDIKVFNDAGELLFVIGKKGEALLEFNAPTFLAAHTNGLLVSDTLNARVHLIKNDDDGGITMNSSSHFYGRRGMKLGNLTRPKGVASDSDGNIYIIESYFDHMLVFSEADQFLLPLGGTGHGPGEFYLPSGMFIDEQDKIYISDMMNGRISVFQFLGSN